MRLREEPLLPERLREDRAEPLLDRELPSLLRARERSSPEELRAVRLRVSERVSERASEALRELRPRADDDPPSRVAERPTRPVFVAPPEVPLDARAVRARLVPSPERPELDAVRLRRAVAEPSERPTVAVRAVRLCPPGSVRVTVRDPRAAYELRGTGSYEP